jgi:HEPN domain-containing protein
MPHYDDIPGPPIEWLRRAKGNLALGKINKPVDVDFEELCFSLQQAAEKALKAVLLYHRIGFRYTHDIQELISLLLDADMEVPEPVRSAAGLTFYAVQARYPSMEAATEEEYRQAVLLAEGVVAWAESIIGK